MTTGKITALRAALLNLAEVAQAQASWSDYARKAGESSIATAFRALAAVSEKDARRADAAQRFEKALWEIRDKELGNPGCPKCRDYEGHLLANIAFEALANVEAKCP